ncbi:hypothetical protein [Dyadobacter sandarakinus]|uniref:Lipoprotein n=1 Tax=Dyadobacter sandarakinus TaxID=2747268 RepID=A0ABX7I214_9BACT|nr:hypothetical protein [Dyadobacter sandarakinus]QRQ99742.1 hypothetical protein HWI92_01820 [Dyadobacter sandarakinus]
MKHLLFLSFLLLVCCDKKQDPEPQGAALQGTFVIPDKPAIVFEMTNDDGFASVLVNHEGKQFAFLNTEKGSEVNMIVASGIYLVSLKTYAKGPDTYVSYKLAEKTQVKYTYQGQVKRVK